MAFPARCGPWHWVAVLLLGLLLGSPAVWRFLIREEKSVALRHELWMARHRRTYKDEAEKKRRREIFQRNLEYVESFNRREDRGYNLSVNRFADLSEEEFRATNYGLLPILEVTPQTGSFRYGNVTDRDVPSSKDWRNEGAVTRVKDQGSCGSCWAFATVAATEGITKIQTGRLMSLSEQELVDCDTGNYGCNGGYPTVASQYIAANGITTGDEYPYHGNVGSCASSYTHRAATISGYEVVTPNNEKALLYALAHQPVTILIDSGSREFHLYDGKHGVFKGPCGNQLNHAVTLVGYGTDPDGTKYWVLKNSWGSWWGENGYMKILRDSGYPQGMCGLASSPSYPVA